jgi:hypothetical protein
MYIPTTHPTYSIPKPTNIPPQDSSDPISYLCAWLALVPQALCVIYVTLIWSTREVEILLMFTGQMGCEALNFMLKRAIKEERPKREFASAWVGQCFFSAEFTW